MIIPEAITRRRLTLEDYEALPDDADYEIIDGVLYVSPRPRREHQVLSARLVIDLGAYLKGNLRGTLVPDADLIIDDKGTYISPDIMYFSADKYTQLRKGEPIQVVPDLVVEILSPGTERYDLITKRNLYARLGVQYYWVANERTKTIEENVLGEDGQYRSRVVAAPDMFVPALFPDLEIDLRSIFA